MPPPTADQRKREREAKRSAEQERSCRRMARHRNGGTAASSLKSVLPLANFNRMSQDQHALGLPKVAYPDQEIPL